MRRTSFVAPLIALALAAPSAEARPVFGPTWADEQPAGSVRTLDPGWDWESAAFGAGAGVGLSVLAALGFSAVRPRPG